jgi:adenine-specific DNA methylase
MINPQEAPTQVELKVELEQTRHEIRKLENTAGRHSREWNVVMAQLKEREAALVERLAAFSNKSGEVTCNKCGWVHFGVSRSWAEAQVREFNFFYDNSPPEVQEQYGRRADIASYEKCFSCGGSYRNFHETVEGEVAAGSTLQPIITL